MQKSRLIRCNDGVALIEFSLVLPLLLIMLLGTLELANFAILNQKLDKVADSMADFVTQGSTVGRRELNTFQQAVPEIMQPYPVTRTQVTVIVSSVANFSTPPPRPPRGQQQACTTAGTPCVTWQYKIIGPGGRGAAASHIGSPGGPANIPGSYNVIAGQNIIVAEAFLQYTPLLSVSQNFVSAFTPATLYKVAVFKPRQGALTTLGP